MKATFMWLLILLATVAHAHNYVVCVGIADYPGRQNDLRVSANDAMAIQKIFATNGHSNVRCLTNGNASVAMVRKAMAETFSKAGVNDVVLFFFSGHGVPNGFVCYDGSLQYRDVVAAMQHSKAKTKIVVADACYAGKMRSTSQHDKSYGTKDTNIMFFLSSRTTEKSLETPFANSFFTIFLERGLRGGADVNRDRTVTARELYDFVHNGVVRESRDRQHPVMWGNFNKNMTVIKW